MKVFLVYATSDNDFVEGLSADLSAQDFTVAPELPAVEMINARVEETDAVLVMLSEALIENTSLLRKLEALKSNQKRIIPLRLGKVSQIPDAIRGTLPLDFSDEEHYQDSLETLIEDLEPPTLRMERVDTDPEDTTTIKLPDDLAETVEIPAVFILPEGIQKKLEHLDPKERFDGVQQLGDIWDQLTPEQTQFAESKLRDLAFQDVNSSVKSIARSTLQLISQPSASTSQAVTPSPVIEEPPVEENDTDRVVAPVQQSGPPPIRQESAAPVPKPHTTAPIVVTTSQADQSDASRVAVITTSIWSYLPLFGIVLALLQGALHEEPLVGLPIALVWLLLPWFNVAIRDNGKLVWNMPGAMIGNGVIGAFLGILGGVILLVLAGMDTIDIVLAAIPGMMYGILIGWLSSLYVVNS